MDNDRRTFLAKCKNHRNGLHPSPPGRSDPKQRRVYTGELVSARSATAVHKKINPHVVISSLIGLPTIETESVDFVRMSCLGTSIPKAEWPIILTEVRRVLRTGGAIEVVDDEMIRGYSGYCPKECQAVEQEDYSFLTPAERASQEDSLHLIDQYFTEMLVERYGMPTTPHRTVDRSMEIVFGANDKKHFRVELPSPDFEVVGTKELRRGGNLFQVFRGKKDAGQSTAPDTATKAQRALGGTPVGEKISGPFLIFYPHGLCRLDASEVRMAACGTMHKVLSCRASLIDSVVGQDTWGKELDELHEMLWEYEQ